MTRLCATCHTNPAITDGRDCRDCLAAYLRQTRRPLVMSPFTRRALDRKLPAKAIA